MDKDKRFIKASWWERLWGIPGIALMGGAMLIKSSIQFSSDWQDCVSSLLFHLRHTMMEVMKIIAFLKKSYDQPTEHIKKQRWYFSKKNVHLIKAMVFPIVMYGYESWTIKKAEH